jgi:prepilin-type N-terminal cleavage/methylation domain-containing protein/prepilin-type processing-associated H-X9-DG protein
MKKKAFTLVELLVVIAILALLLGVLMPALQKARSAAKTIVCTAHCKNLSTAWTVYASDNDSKIVSAMTGYSNYSNHLSKSPLLCSNPWVDWAGYASESPDNEERQIQAIKQGVLYPYSKMPEAYRCPESKRFELRCYSIPDFFGNERINGHVTMGGLEALLTTVEIKRPSERIIFLDEGYVTYGGFTVYYDRAEWWDIPPTRHNNGITLGYADGHSGFVKWRDRDTIDLSQEKPGTSYSQPGNEDLVMIQKGIYGKLGYTP